MKRISEYKALARESMKGSYGQGVAVFFAVAMVQTILNSVFTRLIGDSAALGVIYNILSLIIATIIFNPLLVGISKFFLEQAQGRPDMNNLFYSFKTNLTNTVKVMFIRDVKLVLWMLPSMVIAFAAVIFLDLSVGRVYDTFMLWFPWIFIAFMIPAIIKSLEYSVIIYIVAENPDVRSKDAFRMAREMMKGNKGRLFLLNLSFIGWMWLGILAFLVGIFFVIPYMESAIAHFYLDVKAQAGYSAPVFTEEYDVNKIDNGDTFGL